MTEAKKRDRWGPIGFILAASGSAIGLGNIVFFSANAYRYGAGAFYIPYLVALIVLGVPVMIMELGLGHRTQRAFPEALSRSVGTAGEFIGWWAVLNATIICMYYITILSWVLGMWIGAFGPLWEPKQAVEAFNLEAGSVPFSVAYFFKMITSHRVLLFVPIIWLLNVAIVWKGTKSIEAAVTLFVPLMWVMMIILIVRGLTLPNGIQGAYRLFTPDFKVIFSRPEVWHGAFGQMFFTLSLGFGIMTAYASYLPKNSDQINNSLMICCMNCGFEFIAGLAIFSLLFAFAIVPAATTFSMTFFVIPRGISEFPWGVKFFGVMFFTLLLLAGISSSISLIEAFVSAVMDKYGWSRKRTVIGFAIIGCLGSLIFAAPRIVDASLSHNGTLGLSLLDMADHWAFNYGLLLVGFCECLIIGWKYGAKRLRMFINEHSNLRLGAWFDVLIKFVAPALILIILLTNGLKWIRSGHIYGEEIIPGKSFAARLVVLAWLLFTIVGAAALTFSKTYEEEPTENNSPEASK